MQNKIKLYIYKNLFSKIIKNYKLFIDIKKDILIKYFFWLNNENFLYVNKGFCIKIKWKKNLNMDNFVLYYYLRNMQINQLFFFSSPFIFLIKKKNSDKKNKKIFLL